MIFDILGENNAKNKSTPKNTKDIITKPAVNKENDSITEFPNAPQ